MAKHFISVLGTGNYAETVYYYKNVQGEEIKTKTLFVQEASLKATFNEIAKEDRITIFLTQKAKKANWENRKYTEKDLERLQKNSNNTIKVGDIRVGLKEVLEKSFPQIEVETVEILEGKNEEELWSISDCIYESIKDNEEIIFDVTHGFRSIPIQAITVLNYAKALKNILVNRILYGAYEVGSKRSDGNYYAPIFDITMCNEILNWSVAADAFARYGNSAHIYDLFKEERNRKRRMGDFSLDCLNDVVDNIKCITDSIDTGRGKGFNDKNKSIQGAYDSLSSSLSTLKEDEKDLLKPLSPLFEKIQERIKIFSGESNLEIGLATVQWSIDNNMTQQGYTALEETVKTFICNLYELEETDYDDRENVAKDAVNIINRVTRDLKKKNEQITRERIIKEIKLHDERYHKQQLSDDESIKFFNIIKTIPKEIVNMSSKIGQMRNSINHFGYDKGGFKSDTLTNNLKRYYKEFLEIVDKYKDVDFSRKD